MEIQTAAYYVTLVNRPTTGLVAALMLVTAAAFDFRGGRSPESDSPIVMEVLDRIFDN
ncbi:MAG: hypothetical protein ACLSA6_04705 [Holdemania massiliensis]